LTAKISRYRVTSVELGLTGFFPVMAATVPHTRGDEPKEDLGEKIKQDRSPHPWELTDHDFINFKK
jgi:hypothetical protein